MLNSRLHTNAMRQAWGVYRDLLHQHPLSTKAITAAALAGAADVVCQSLERMPYSNITANSEGGEEARNWNRTFQVAVVGLLWSGPVSHSWYNLLERSVRVKHQLGGLTIRMILDAVVFSPVAGTCCHRKIFLG